MVDLVWISFFVPVMVFTVQGNAKYNTGSIVSSNVLTAEGASPVL